jgi:hypothetical protein
VRYISAGEDQHEHQQHQQTKQFIHSSTDLLLSLYILIYTEHQPERTSRKSRTINMPTSHISTPIAGTSAATVIAALHNHDLMIKTLCPALVSYHFIGGNKSSQATYSITDRKPIGQVCTSTLSSLINPHHSQHHPPVTPNTPNNQRRCILLTLPSLDNIHPPTHQHPNRR